MHVCFDWGRHLVLSFKCCIKPCESFVLLLSPHCCYITLSFPLSCWWDACSLWNIWFVFRSLQKVFFLWFKWNVWFVVGITGYKTFYCRKECVKGRCANSMRWESEVDVNIQPFDQMAVAVLFFWQLRKTNISFNPCLLYLFRLQWHSCLNKSHNYRCGCWMGFKFVYSSCFPVVIKSLWSELHFKSISPFFPPVISFCPSLYYLIMGKKL